MSQTANRVPSGPKLSRLTAAAVILGNNLRLLRFLQRRYGDVFAMQMPSLGPAVVVSSPELVKQVLTAKPDVLLTGQGNPLGSVLGPGSLFSMDREEHLRERRLLLPPFHGDRMRSYEGIIEEEARKEMASWPAGQEFATLPAFMRITLNSILRAVFGAEGPNQERLGELLPKFVELGSRMAMLPWLKRDLGPRSPGGRFHRERRMYDEIIDQMIDEALADPHLEDRVDVMALLLRAHYDDGSSMSRAGISDELLTLLAAGHETTATQLAWAVERLRRHPWILQRLRQEAEGDGKELRLATINELQRSRPVITAFGRRVATDFELGGYVVPQGHQVIVSTMLVHHDERFFDRAEEFQPDRFVGCKPDTYTWIPFGGGTRRCIGAAFAQMEMDVVLRILLREFDLKTTPAPGEQWRSRGVAFAPARGGLGVVEPRSRAADGQQSPPVGLAAVA
jgi:cytochrome P450 family 138